jgi:SecY
VVTATVLLSLLSVFVPRLAALARTGDAGWQRRGQYTRYIAVVLAWVSAARLAQGVVQTCTLATGAVLVMWLSEQITQRGVGHGLSLLVVSDLLAPLPRAVLNAEFLAPAGWAVGGLVATTLVVVVLRARRVLEASPPRLSAKPAALRVPVVVSVVPLIFAEALSPRLDDPWISTSLFCGLTIFFLFFCAGLWRYPPVAPSVERVHRRLAVSGAIFFALLCCLLPLPLGPALLVAVGTLVQALDDAGRLVPESTKRVTPPS